MEFKNDKQKSKRPARTTKHIDSRKKDGKQASTLHHERKRRPKATWRKTLQKNQDTADNIKFDDQAKQIFLDCLKKTNLKQRAADKAEVTMKTVNRHKDNDPEFAEAYQAALDHYKDDFVGHHWNLARNGTTRKRFDRDGNVVEQWKEYPIQLIVKELQKLDPAYRDKQTIDMNNTSQGIMLAPAEMTPEDWIKAQEAKNASKAAPDSTKQDKPAETAPGESERATVAAVA